MSTQSCHSTVVRRDCNFAANLIGHGSLQVFIALAPWRPEAAGRIRNQQLQIEHAAHGRYSSQVGDGPLDTGICKNWIEMC